MFTCVVLQVVNVNIKRQTSSSLYYWE